MSREDDSQMFLALKYDFVRTGLVRLQSMSSVEAFSLMEYNSRNSSKEKELM